MVQTEVPAGDNETGAPTKTMVGGTVKSGSSAKGTKASTSERILIGVIVTLVVVVAIGGIVLTLVLNARKGKHKSTSAAGWSGDDVFPYDDNWSFDDLFSYDEHSFSGEYGEPIVEDPFEIDASLFSSKVTEPYASIEDLRKDIEALTKTYVNTLILREANAYNFHDDYFHFTDAMAEPMPAMEMADEMADSHKASGASGFFQDVDDFETYQHEAGVVKSDMVKSNGAYVFAAADKSIKVWDLEGNIFEKTTIKSAGSNEHSITINALLMNPEGNKLVVISSDYGKYTKDSIIDNPLRTQVTVFDIEGSSLTEISQTYIDGYHTHSYNVGNNIHIVTTTTLRTWDILDNRLYRHTFNGGDQLTNEEYFYAASLRAEKIMPEFVDQLINLVSKEDEIFLSKIVGFQSSVNDYKSITQISSFDISKVVDEDGMELHGSKSLVLQPAAYGYVYATDEWIWVANANSFWGLEKQNISEQTVLLGFKLDGTFSRFAAVSTVPGRLLSQFSIDFVKDDDKEYVRIAVTESFFQNNMWRPQPIMPNLGVESGDETESRTLNEIIIFEIPKVEDGSQMVHELIKLSSVEVGKKDEIITAVRFFDNISYVVTFERTDPFYVLDLSDPMDPKILGELEVPGFSQFMHPIKEDNSMLLTVGRDADEFGFDTGFQISIFDSAIPTEPKLVDRIVIGNDRLSSTGSSASWDERAFRYIQVGEVGRLIIPFYSYSYDNFGYSSESFDGFSVFGVDLSKTELLITREIDINHYVESNFNNYDSRGCYCSQVYMPGRSLVFDGNLMTMKNSLVVSTSLDSEETNWSLSLQEDKNCCMP